VKFLLQLVLIAVTACFSTTATAKLNHAVIMNESEIVISHAQGEINLTEEHIRIFWSRVEKLATECGCWIWIGACGDSTHGQQRIHDVICATHRVSWAIHHGPIPSGLNVLHHCDNPSCVRPDHLFLGTQQDNVDDMMRKGRASTGARHSEILKRVVQRGANHVFKRRPDLIPRGEAQGQAKLKTIDVIAIREIYARGFVTQQQLGTMYGVHQNCISQIIRRVRWSHIA
jgi:hypothetical protein